MKRTEKQKAIKLRLAGKSYNEIRKILNIPSKGTLSYWFKDLHLPKAAVERLESKMRLARERGLLDFNLRRTRDIELENKKIREGAAVTIGKLSQRELLLVGAALYWGEGTKAEKYNTVAFSNSDPSMTALFLRFVRDVLKVNNDKIRAGIQIHPNIEAARAKYFWSKVTNLPIDRFYITKQISISSKLKRPQRFLPYGTAVVKVNSRALFYEIKGYIDGLSEQI